jgi:hypothetical protein
MKKIILLLLLIAVFSSCGPKRLGCGPGRCIIEKENSVLEKKFPKQLNS